MWKLKINKHTEFGWKIAKVVFEDTRIDLRRGVIQGERKSTRYPRNELLNIRIHYIDIKDGKILIRAANSATELLRDASKAKTRTTKRLNRGNFDLEMTNVEEIERTHMKLVGDQ